MKKLLKILPVIMVVCLVLTSVFAVGKPDMDELTNGGNQSETVRLTVANIWKTINTVVQVLAVGAVVFAGLRYMFASADQKADIKKSMGVLAIGAILVFGATIVLGIVADTADEILPEQQTNQQGN